MKLSKTTIAATIAALFVGGLISGKIGGPSVMPPQPEGIWRTTYSKLKWQTPEDEDRYRKRHSPSVSWKSWSRGSMAVGEVDSESMESCPN